jgi:hypothetical protein
MCAPADFSARNGSVRVRNESGRSAAANGLFVLCSCVLLLGACDYVQPIEQVCAKKLGPTELRVTAAPVEYTTDHTRPGDELTRMGAPGGGRVIMGLTKTTMRSSIKIGGRGLTNPVTRKHCMRPVVDVELAFEPMTVFISRDSPEGSCQFSVTMQHELRHVSAFSDFLDSAVVQVDRDLREYFGNRIFYFASEAEAARRMGDDTRERLGPFVTESMKQVDTLQALLDTREEYDRLERQCGSSGSASP